MDYWIDTARIFNPEETESFPLIHMTKSWSILELILKEGLKPSYCIENITNNSEDKSACFPMICTSNVSIDFAISHQRSYGTLGIVFKKEWGEENDFNPVLYLERNSSLTSEIITNFKKIKAISEDEIHNALDGINTNYKSYFTNQLIKIFAHSKNYDGNLIRDNQLLAIKYPFGMEREWRKIIREDNVKYFLVGKDLENKRNFNQSINHIRVDYQLNHLKAVIVECNWQVEEVKKIISQKFGLTNFPNEIEIRLNTIRHVPDEG